MREIKFRGKSEKNSEWLVGSLVDFGNFKCIWTFDADFYDLVQRDRRLSPEYIIDPATVGQYTGFKDIDGIEIYEGDILECYSAIYSLIRHEGGCYELHEQGNEKVFFLFRNHSKIKVIGNIHEHPNLLTNN